jgi:phage-related protein
MPEPWTILFFQDNDTSIPARDYLLGLEPGEQKRFQVRLSILTEKGLGTGKPIMDHLEHNLYELRLENSPHNPRFLFCAMIGRRIYLLHGFSKTGQSNDKVPESEKNIARKRREILEAREAQRQNEMLKVTGSKSTAKRTPKKSAPKKTDRAKGKAKKVKK